MTMSDTLLRRRPRRSRRRNRLGDGAVGYDPSYSPEYDAFPFGLVGVNLPRNYGFQDYDYQPLALPESEAIEIASGLSPRGPVRLLTNSLHDMCSVIPQDLTAGPSGALIWNPIQNMRELAKTISRLNAHGAVGIITCLDGVTTYPPKETWATRGKVEMHGFLAAWARWWAERFNPHELVLSPWNENPDSDAALNNDLLNMAIAAIRDGAPQHWILAGGPRWSRDWSSDIAAFALDNPFRVIVDGHAYIKTDATWADGLAVKKAAAEALKLGFAFGEISQKQGNGTDFASPTDPTRIADLFTAYAGGRAHSIPMLAWNDAGALNPMRVFDFTAPTSGVPRSLKWIAVCRDAMHGIQPPTPAGAQMIAEDGDRLITEDGDTLVTE